MTKGTTTSNTTMSSPKLSKLSILGAFNETTKQASKAAEERKRLAEEEQKANELKKEQQREDRKKKREEKQRTLCSPSRLFADLFFSTVPT